MDVASEIAELKRRVGDLEGAMNVLYGRMASIQPEIRAVRQQSSEGFAGVGETLERVLSRLDTMNTQIWSLRDDLPVVVGDILARSAAADGAGSE